MTQPIGGYGRSYDYARHDDPQAESSTSKAAREFCTTAKTVTSGFLCDEPTVVSNACRTPDNDIDKFVCDDKKMQDLQSGVWEATKDALKMIFGAIVGGKR